MIERRMRDSVERMMTRTKTVLISLIPAFWLVAAMNCFGQALGARNDHPLSGAVVGTGHSTHDLPQLESSFDQAFRRAGRRVNIQPSEDDFGPAGLEETIHCPWQRTTGLLPYSSRDLAQCWQFLWRTAREPRAPSSLS